MTHHANTRTRSPQRIPAVLLTIVMTMALLALAPAASAADYVRISSVQTFDEPAIPGFFNGRFFNPRRVAADSTTGHFVVAGGGDPRVRVFEPTPGGAQFLTAFSVPDPQGIAADSSTGDVYTTHPAVSERQFVRIDPAVDGGTFTLTFDGATTDPIAHNAGAASVRAALEALPGIGAGDVQVNVGSGSDPRGYTVSFVGALANTDVPELSVDPSGLTPPGSTADVDTFRPGASAPAIAKYSPDSHANPSDYTEDAGFTSPAQGAGIGEVGSFGTYSSGSFSSSVVAPLAVDPIPTAAGTPGTHDILIADPGKNLIQRFDSDGDFVSSFDGSSTGTPFAGLHDLAIDGSGRILVADEVAGTLRAVRFDPDGTNPLVLGPVPNASPNRVVVAADPDTDELFVSSKVTNPNQIYRFDATGAQLGDPFGASGLAFNGSLFGLANAGSDPPRLYAVASSGPAVQIFEETAPPIVTIDPVAPADLAPVEGPGGVSAYQAVFTGTVNPDGDPLSECRFDYVAEDQHAIDGFASATSVPCDPDAAAIGDGTDPVAVTATADDLEPDTAYRVRLFASKGGDLTGEAQTGPFDVPAAPPFFAAERIFSRTDTSATFTATVNPNNNEVVACEFQYVTETAFGSTGFADLSSGGTAPCDPGPAGIGGGFGPVEVFADIDGLDPSTTYHFRVVADNGVEVDPIGDPGNTAAASADATFATRAPIAFPQRGYELVSALEANGVRSVANIASLDGDHFAYASAILPLPGAETGRLTPFRASRNPDGSWSQTYMGPPTPRSGDTNTAMPPPVYSGADLSRAVWGTGGGVDPDDANGVGDTYLRDADGAIAWLSRDPAIPPGEAQTDTARCAATAVALHVSADGSRVLFPCERRLLPADPSQEEVNSLYEWNSGGLGLVGIDPETGEGFAAGSTLGSGGSSRGVQTTRNAVSPDGRRVAFQSGASAATQRLFVRIDGESTVEASASAIDPTPVDVSYRGADGDTRQLFFTSSSPLTEDSSAPDTANGAADLYRYDVAGGELLDLASHPGGTGVRQVLWVSDDGRRVYFLAAAALTPEAAPRPQCYVVFGSLANGGYTRGACNLYLAQLDGPADQTPELTLIAAGEIPLEASEREPSFNAGRARQAVANADGSVLAFRSREALVPGRQTGSAAGAGNLTAGSNLVTGLTTSKGTFTVGSLITGPGVFAGFGGTFITAVDPDAGTLTLSEPATASVAGAELTGHGHLQVYVYEAEREELSCASCPADGSAPPSWASLTPISFRQDGGEALVIGREGEANLNVPHARNVAADGAVFFFSPSPLLAADPGDRSSVYEWRGGKLKILSSPGARFHATFADAAADGSTVFFGSSNQLLRGVPGGFGRVYAARAGVPDWEPPLPAPPCTGEDCKPVATPQPNYAAPSTSTVSGRGNLVEGRSCARPARQAQRLSQRAKRLRRAANRSSGGRRSAQMRRKARRFATAAKKRSAAARRCRRANRKARR